MGAGSNAASVVFAMEWVPQYRAPFYNGLRERLRADGIDVRLIHGDPPASRRQRLDDESLPWAEVVPNRFLTVKGLELTWQPVLRKLQGADLIVLQQETGLVINYPAVLAAKMGGPPVALWGHGHNFNPREAARSAEWVKAKATRFADWAFAYTERSAEVFRSIGMPADRITVVQNSMDTRSLTQPEGDVSAEVDELIAGLASREARVGWIVSALDRWKRVEYLLDVLDRIRADVPSFEFLALGAGTDAEILTAAAGSRPWLHALGPVFGADKAALGRRAEVTIHPGLAGLHVIETFATATPMVTADIDYHSHEIDYLTPGVDSVMLPADAEAAEMASAVVELLTDAGACRLAALQDGCRRATEVYTLDAMIERFAGGIRAALGRTA